MKTPRPNEPKRRPGTARYRRLALTTSVVIRSRRVRSKPPGDSLAVALLDKVNDRRSAAGRMSSTGSDVQPPPTDLRKLTEHPVPTSAPRRRRRTAR